MPNVLKKKFFSLLITYFKFFPFLFSFLRDMFQVISQEVELKKFREWDSPFVLDFIFFRYFCPSIVDPVKWQIVEQLPPSALQGCIAASKILNDLALKNIDKWEKDINEWIQQRNPVLFEFIRKLIVKKKKKNLKFL